MFNTLDPKHQTDDSRHAASHESHSSRTAPQPLAYASPATSNGYPGPYLGPPPDRESRQVAMLAHLSGILTGIIGPLIIWLIQRGKQPFVEDQSKEALNFQLMVLVIAMSIGIGLLALSCLTQMFGPALFLLFDAAAILVVVALAVSACIAASRGKAYRYPINIRFIR